MLRKILVFFQFYSLLKRCKVQWKLTNRWQFLHKTFYVLVQVNGTTAVYLRLCIPSGVKSLIELLPERLYSVLAISGHSCLLLFSS